ncbi:MAG: hypothetical protein ACREQ4_00975 [Candidatus Binataceae bacterium]
MPSAVLVIRNLRARSNVAEILQFLNEAKSPIRVISVRLASRRGALRDAREWRPGNEPLSRIADEIQSYLETGEDEEEVTVVRLE